MVAFRESLTIAIRGDSSHLSRELDRVGERISSLSERLGRFNRAASEMGRSFERIGLAIGPLQTISTLLERITSQIRLLSRTPIVLDIRPAVQSLLILGRLIDATAARLARLSAVGTVGDAGGATGPIRAYASGGMVTGPGGVDRVPAMLTAGEFVIRRPAVQQLGAAFLSALNQSSPTNPRPTLMPGPPVGQSTSITNNLGGVTVNVSQVGEVAGVVRDLQFRDSALRARRG
ncbi:hypothetical protein Mal52_10490 [Symmachiella dynata]|uniref:Uncharacterized protein n=1 Tax=Symmachiella dynata TaxID=2527995 RepID=A0A517ZJD0_9PLAN|nr:hypothetical protein [Symmachiella dynata]QDU42586.1 hypothetical protein Mal52_10490 [Symmachiella dynata]